MISEFISPLHGRAILYEDKIVVIKGGMAAGIPFAGNAERTIYLRQLSGVTVKKGGLSPGHIHFATGGSESKTSYKDNLKSDSSILFGAQLNNQALKFKAVVEKQLSNIYNTQPNFTVTQPIFTGSQADEIKKFKDLFDSGAITSEEFEQKKKEIFGIHNSDSGKSSSVQKQIVRVESSAKKKGNGCLIFTLLFIFFIAFIVQTETKSLKKTINQSSSEVSATDDIDSLKKCAELTDEELVIVKNVLDQCEVDYIDAEYEEAFNDMFDDGVWGYCLKTKKVDNVMLYLSKVDNSVIRVRYLDNNLWSDGEFKNTLTYLLNRPALELIGDTTGTSQYSYIHIKGKIKNNTGKTYSYVQVIFGIYDANGNKVGTALDNIGGLGAYETWAFDAIGVSGSNYRLEDIRGR